LIEKHQPKDNTIGLEAKAAAQEAKAIARQQLNLPPKDPKTGQFKKRSPAERKAPAPAPENSGNSTHAANAGAVRHVHVVDWLFGS
jgi:hypothetical protein